MAVVVGLAARAARRPRQPRHHRPDGGRRPPRRPAALLVATLAQGRLELLAEAMQDRPAALARRARWGLKPEKKGEASASKCARKRTAAYVGGRLEPAGEGITIGNFNKK